MYNITFMDTANSPINYMDGLMAVENGIIPAFILLIVFFVGFIMFKAYNTKVAMVGASGLTTVIGLFFFLLGWIHYTILMFPIIMLLGTIIAYFTLDYSHASFPPLMKLTPKWRVFIRFMRNFCLRKNSNPRGSQITLQPRVEINKQNGGKTKWLKNM